MGLIVAKTSSILRERFFFLRLEFILDIVDFASSLEDLIVNDGSYSGFLMAFIEKRIDSLISSYTQLINENTLYYNFRNYIFILAKINEKSWI